MPLAQIAKAMKVIDLNCDVGEGVGNEADLLPFVSSCNISCGLHAGDEQTIQQVIDLAIKYDVAIGAHPSFDDRKTFGRMEVHLPAPELKALIQNQVLKMKEMITAAGGCLGHVKPHGALYNMAAKSIEISDIIVSAIEEIDPNLLLFGLAESKIMQVASGRLNFIAEGFADRRYQSKNQLQSRLEGGIIIDIEEIKAHVLNLLNNGQVAVPNGLEMLSVETLCLHGDTPKAVDTVKEIHHLLIKEGFEIKSFGK